MPTATSSSPPTCGVTSSTSFCLYSASCSGLAWNNAILSSLLFRCWTVGTVARRRAEVSIELVSLRSHNLATDGAVGLADLVGEAPLVRAKPEVRAPGAHQPPL